MRLLKAFWNEIFKVYEFRNRDHIWLFLKFQNSDQTKFEKIIQGTLLKNGVYENFRYFLKNSKLQLTAGWGKTTNLNKFRSPDVLDAPVDIISTSKCKTLPESIHKVFNIILYFIYSVWILNVTLNAKKNRNVKANFWL